MIKPRQLGIRNSKTNGHHLNASCQKSRIPIWTHAPMHLRQMFVSIEELASRMDVKCTGMGKREVTRLRVSRLLTPSGHGARVHAT